MLLHSCFQFRRSDWRIRSLPIVALVFAGWISAVEVPFQANDAAPNSYSTWISGFPGLTDTSPSGDPDHDGIPNAIEFVLGSDPSVPDDPSILPSGSLVTITEGPGDFVPAGRYLKFTWRRADRAVDLEPWVEISSGLGEGWTAVEGGANGVVVNEFAEDYGPFLDRVEVFIPVSLALNGKLFARLRVSVP